MPLTCDRVLPRLIAPDVECAWCVHAMREPTLMGQSLVAPGHCDDYAPAAIAGELHELRFHVHCGETIGDADHAAHADIALPLLAGPTIVMYDSAPVPTSYVGAAADRDRYDRRMHWALDVAESMKFARAGWRVIRLREPGQEPTSPLDLALPHRIVEGHDNEAALRLAVRHVLGIIEANVVAA